MYTNLALSLLPCRVAAAVPGDGWSCGGTVTRPPEVRSGHSFPLRSQVALQGWGGGLERGRQKPKGGQPHPHPGSPHPLSMGPGPPGSARIARGRVAGKDTIPLKASGLVLSSKASAPSPPTHPSPPGAWSRPRPPPGPFGPPPHPHPRGAQLPARPAAVAAAPTGKVPRRLGTTRGQACPQAKGVSNPRRRLGAPRSLAAPRAPLLQARPGGVGGNAPCRPGPGAGGPERVFLPPRDREFQPQAARSKTRNPDRGSALAPRRERLKGPGAAPAAPLPRRRAGRRASAASPAVAAITTAASAGRETPSARYRRWWTRVGPSKPRPGPRQAPPLPAPP